MYSFATIKERTKPIAMIILSVLRISIRIENSNLEPNISISYHTLRLILKYYFRIYFLIPQLNILFPGVFCVGELSSITLTCRYI